LFFGSPFFVKLQEGEMGRLEVDGLSVHTTREAPLGDIALGCAGMLSAADDAPWPALGAAFAANFDNVGLAVMELRGCGESNGLRGGVSLDCLYIYFFYINAIFYFSNFIITLCCARIYCSTPRFGEYAAECDDFERVFDALRSEGARIVGLMGHSKGAAVAALLHARITHGPAPVPHLPLMLLSGRAEFASGAGVVERFSAADLARDSFTWKPFAGRHHQQPGSRPRWWHGRADDIAVSITRAGLAERARLDVFGPVAAAGERVLIVHGSGDSIVPARDAAALAARAPRATVEIIEGADHVWREERDAQRLTACIVAWWRNQAI
jgi:pimeloyl-ACP methyl ester carboxylesterase